MNLPLRLLHHRALRRRRRRKRSYRTNSSSIVSKAPLCPSTVWAATHLQLDVDVLKHDVAICRVLVTGRGLVLNHKVGVLAKGNGGGVAHTQAISSHPSLPELQSSVHSTVKTSEAPLVCTLLWTP